MSFPGHFYSPIPDRAELERDHQRIFEKNRYCLADIDLNASGQAELVGRLATYARGFSFSATVNSARRFYLDNPYFAGSDAYLLHAMMREFRPTRIIEIGSGFSSAAMLDTNEQFLDGRTCFTFIDPHPQRLLELLKGVDVGNVEVTSKKIQDVEVDVFAGLQENDFLFVDSSHVSKIGSDVNHIIFEILPALKSGVIIHFHDVFWPFEYPKEWIDAGRAWNEAYLLRAFLQCNKSFKIILFLSYLERCRSELASNLAPQRWTEYRTNGHIGGSSLWLQKIA